MTPQTLPNPTLTAAAAEHFLHGWLQLLDSNAALSSFYPYLVDGPFEEWIYPGVSIPDRAALEAYFQATWGNIREQHNHLEALDITDVGDGSFLIVARVLWTATTAGDQRMAMPLQYTILLGSGSCAADPEGQHPKVRRYKVAPNIST